MPKMAIPTDSQAREWANKTSQRIGAMTTLAEIEALLDDKDFEMHLEAMRENHLRTAHEIEDYLESQREHISRKDTT